MTFDELISRTPKVTLADFIQLWLLGYDDKIYINLYCEGMCLEEVRIISNDLNKYYEREIAYFEEADYDSHAILDIYLKEKKS